MCRHSTSPSKTKRVSGGWEGQPGQPGMGTRGLTPCLQRGWFLLLGSSVKGRSWVSAMARSHV